MLVFSAISVVGTRFGGLNFVALVHCTFNSRAITATSVFGTTMKAKIKFIEDIAFSWWFTAFHRSHQIYVEIL